MAYKVENIIKNSCNEIRKNEMIEKMIKSNEKKELAYESVREEYNRQKDFKDALA